MNDAKFFFEDFADFVKDPPKNFMEDPEDSDKFMEEAEDFMKDSESFMVDGKHFIKYCRFKTEMDRTDNF